MRGTARPPALPQIIAYEIVKKRFARSSDDSQVAMMQYGSGTSVLPRDGEAPAGVLPGCDRCGRSQPRRCLTRTTRSWPGAVLHCWPAVEQLWEPEYWPAFPPADKYRSAIDRLLVLASERLQVSKQCSSFGLSPASVLRLCTGLHRQVTFSRSDSDDVS